MKKRFFFFFLSCIAILFYPFLDAACTPYCDSFLTCVTIPDDCQNSCSDPDFFGKTFFCIRPQDSNSALRLAKIATEDHTKSWGIDLSLGAQQSFARQKNLLAQWFLFNGCTTVTVGIPNDLTSFTVDGGQLGLLTTDGANGPLGILSLNPTLKNGIIVANAWFDLSAYVCGLWLRTYLTLAHTKTNLGMHACSTNVAQSGNYPEGAYTTDCNEAPLQYSSVCSAFMGNKSFGKIPDLKYAKFYNNSKKKTALASIRTDLNYDVIQSTDGFLNCGGCLVIPTGNKPQGHFIFEPMVGANGSWQIGGTLLGAYHCLRNSEKNSVDFYADATVTYVSKSKQTRVFSLKNNGAGSQYMLLKVFDLSVGAVLAGERVANVFAGQADIGGMGMFDGSLMMHFERCNGFCFDIGYNLWARSKEQIGDTAFLRKFTENTYGIKGNLPLTTIDSLSGLCIGDLTTASNSTLGNPAAPDATTKIVEVCDVDFNTPLQPSAFSNKLFISMGYSPSVECSDYTIRLFVEGEVEIGQKKKALNQWALNINVAVSL